MGVYICLQFLGNLAAKLTLYKICFVYPLDPIEDLGFFSVHWTIYSVSQRGRGGGGVPKGRF